MVHFKQVAIIGAGLIGGSLGMILRRKRLADQVVGIGRRVENLKLAVELGAIDRYVVDPKEGVDRKSTRLNSSHVSESRMPSSA